MNRAVSEYLVVTYEGGIARERKDVLTVEEPLEMRLENGATGEQTTVAITMRTPGHDDELAIGFLVSERLVALTDQLETHWAKGDAMAIVVRVAPESFRKVLDEPVLNRYFQVSSSCGVCGRTSLDNLIERGYCRVPAGKAVEPAVLYGLTDTLENKQSVFEKTGSLHAAGLFDANGGLLSLREDVGRHNAVDKVIGESFRLKRLPVFDNILMVSGRVSYEIVQKAIAAGIGIIAAISGPSDLAVKLAHEFGVTIVGFIRGTRFNVYTHPERIARSERL